MNAQDAEFSTLKLLKFAYTVHTAGLSICNLKPCGVVYNIVTKFTVVHVNTARQKIDLFLLEHNYTIGILL
jgi:hypothetical protein